MALEGMSSTWKHFQNPSITKLCFQSQNMMFAFYSVAPVVDEQFDAMTHLLYEVSS